MSLLRRLFGKGEPPPKKKPEEAVIIRFENAVADWTLFFEWVPQLQEAIDASGAGEYDGNELATNLADGFVYLYGPSADRLFSVVAPLFAVAPIFKTVEARLRYGDVRDENARVAKIQIKPSA